MGSLLALVEIEDTHYAHLQAFEKLFDKIGKSKDRTKLLGLVKEHFPDTVIPELDAAAPVNARIDELEKKLADRDRQEAEAAANRTIAEQRQKLRQEGWDDEGISAIEDHMRQKHVPDYDTAAAYIRAQAPKDTPLPSTFAGQKFDWFRPPKDDDRLKMLASGPQGARAYQDSVVSEWLTERGSRRNGWGGQ